MNYDPNPLKGISIQEAIYLSNSSDDNVRRNANYILASYQQSMEDRRKSKEITQSTTLESISQSIKERK